MSETKVKLEKHVSGLFKKSDELEDAPKISNQVDNWLNEIFSSETNGFREIVVTALAGKFLNQKFNPTIFYDCKPRGIYPSIRIELQKRGIPCGKDGPLNITKAVKKIDERWVKGRHGKDQAAARAVVGIFKFISSATPEDLENLEASVYKRFSLLGSAATSVILTSVNSYDVLFLARLCKSLCDESTWAGNVPQKIVALLLETNAEITKSKIVVKGGNQSAQASDRGSKKPGDLWEIDEDTGDIFHVYEITLRPVGIRRLTESSESVQSSGMGAEEVTVLCRTRELQEDIKSKLKGSSTIQINGVTYEIHDIYFWIPIVLERIGKEGRKKFYSRLKDFVNLPSTPGKVKGVWNSFYK